MTSQYQTSPKRAYPPASVKVELNQLPPLPSKQSSPSSRRNQSSWPCGSSLSTPATSPSKRYSLSLKPSMMNTTFAQDQETAASSSQGYLHTASEDRTRSPTDEERNKVVLLSLLSVSGLSDFMFFGSHPYLFHLYTKQAPRLDLYYDLKLIHVPVQLRATTPSYLESVVAIIGQSQKRNHLTGQETESCHGWVRPYDKDEVVEVLQQIDQMNKINITADLKHREAAKIKKKGCDSESQRPKLLKVIARVVQIEALGTSEAFGGIGGTNAGPTVSGLYQRSVPARVGKVSPNDENGEGSYPGACCELTVGAGERRFTGMLEWKVTLID